MLAPYCKGKGLRLNIELKNSEIRYEGMEQKVIDMVSEFNPPPDMPHLHPLLSA